MMRLIGLALLAALGSGQVMAQACVVHVNSNADRLDIKVCQENLNIPPKLFADGFCHPDLPGQKVEVAYVEQCPSGSFGVCHNAQVSNMPYRQNIHYYGVASDAAYLKPFCEGKNQGTWQIP